MSFAGSKRPHKTTKGLSSVSISILVLTNNTCTMPVSFGVNGFGRIGRLVVRAALEHPGKNF
jgi:hypothetical protein